MDLGSVLGFGFLRQVLEVRASGQRVVVAENAPKQQQNGEQ